MHKSVGAHRGQRYQSCLQLELKNIVSYPLGHWKLIRLFRKSSSTLYH